MSVSPSRNALRQWVRPGRSSRVPEAWSSQRWCASTPAAQDWETIVTVAFLDLGAATEVILTHERLNPPERRALAENGWSSMLDALDSVVSSTLVDI
jgi:hypothetical protein